MLDQLRPRLLASAQVRRRSDGTEGIYDPATGHWFETAADQANLVQFFDGQHTLLEVSAEYLGKYGFVPFAALNDLVRSLADAGLLADSADGQSALGYGDRTSWLDLLGPQVLVRRATSVPTAVRVAEVLGWVALAVWLGWSPHPSLEPYDVLLVYPGAMLALTLRDTFKSAVCALFGFPPPSTLVTQMLGVVHVVPDHAVSVLMDRRPRILANLAALAGSVCALAIAAPRPGVWGGAFVVFFIDLCPFVPSSAAALLSIFTGRADLREHVRAYLGLPLLKNLLAFKLPRAERDLFFTGLLSAAWVALLVWATVVLGFGSATRLIDVGGVQPDGWRVWLAYGGAATLFALCPLVLLVVIHQALEATFSFLWLPSVGGGKHTRGAADLAAFRGIPLFSKLSDDDLGNIAAQSREVSYDPGQAIVEQGSQGDTFYSVRWGAVLVERQDDQRARVVARLGTGDCFGETAILKDGVRTATVRAITETVVIELPTRAFEQVVATVAGVDFAAVLRAATAVGKSRLFKDLPPERLSALAMKFVPRSVGAGTNVVTLGETGDEFYLVGKGSLEVLDATGKQLVKLGDGDHFGEIALLRNVPRTATVRTITESLLLVLSREVFLQALTADLSLSARAQEIAESRVQAQTAQPAGAPS